MTSGSLRHGRGWMGAIQRRFLDGGGGARLDCCHCGSPRLWTGADRHRRRRRMGQREQPNGEPGQRLDPQGPLPGTERELPRLGALPGSGGCGREHRPDTRCVLLDRGVERPPPPDCGLTITVSASADSWIDRTNARRNHDTDTSLRVRGQRSTDVYRTLVRFALAADPPTGCQVESATLRMHAGTWTQDRTLQAVRLASTWAERTVTWANQPATTGMAAVRTSGAGWRQWAVASQVQAMYDEANHGFLIRDAVTGGSGEQRLYSRERRTNRPELVVTFRPIDRPRHVHRQGGSAARRTVRAVRGGCSAALWTADTRRLRRVTSLNTGKEQ